MAAACATGDVAAMPNKFWRLGSSSVITARRTYPQGQSCWLDCGRFQRLAVCTSGTGSRDTAWLQKHARRGLNGLPRLGITGLHQLALLRRISATDQNNDRGSSSPVTVPHYFLLPLQIRIGATPRAARRATACFKAFARGGQKMADMTRKRDWRPVRTLFMGGV